LSAKNWLKFIVLGLVWGSSFLWIKVALNEVGPFTLVMFRAGIAFLGLSVVWILKKPVMQWHDLWKFAFMGVFNHAMPIVLVSWSEKHISSGLAAILNSTTPLFTILIASIFLSEERITSKRALGLFLGFAGVFIIASNDLGQSDSSRGIGILTMLLAACCYAASSVFARRMMHGVSFEAQSIGQMGMAFLFISPSAAIIEAPLHIPTLGLTSLALIWLGLLGSAVSVLLWFSLIHAVGPTKTSMSSYLFPLVGVILGVIVLDERPDWRMLIGGALIILAVVIVNSFSGKDNKFKLGSSKKIERTDGRKDN
jgi:drug/metabolite transporter (DMT)-like permease